MKLIRHVYRALALAAALSIGASSAVAGSSGKITGTVTDAGTKEALVGVSVVLEGTRTGASSDIDGSFIILNVPPGIYTVRATGVGYRPSVISNVKVQIDLTTRLDIQLSSTTIELKDEVLIVAQRPIIQKDLTSSSSKIGADQIKAFPVEDVAGLVNLQAGVVDGHFRGGRSGEVLYLIDGIPVTDAYSGNAGVTAENQSIQELEIISGTFNAEYGQAMSGIVNQVTKDGGEKFAGDISFYTGDYVSGNTELFPNVDNISPRSIYNLQASLSGPVVNDVTFFVSGRRYYNDGYLYGIRKFMPTDSSNFSSDDPSQWYVGSTGDGSYVPMNFEKRSTIQAKVAVRLFDGDKLRAQVLVQNKDYRDYDHRYKYNPDGAYKNFTRGMLAAASYTRVFSGTTFLEANAAWFSNREQSYVYEDPYDTRFPDSRKILQASGSAFLVGGAGNIHSHREARTITLKADLVSQATAEHQIKAGVEGKIHRMWVHNFGIQNDQTTNYLPRPVEYGNSDFAHTTLRPVQYSAYVQDKMEFSDLIVNAGLRYDFFDSKGDVLTEQIRLGRVSQFTDAEPEQQISPRIGLAFPITDRGVLHLSYGHFFQIPAFDILYLNPAYNINASEAFQVGNPGLKSQRTVAYELGLQQQMSDDIGIDVSVFYKDIRNLIGTEVFDIGNGTIYSRFVNRDYGFVRGFIFTLEKRFADGFSANIDYTFSIAKANASDPNSVFIDNQSVPPVESQKQLAPVDWDRRQALNVTATIGPPTDYTISLIGRIGTGLPYSPSQQNQRTGLLNSENKPVNLSADLYVTKYFTVNGTAINVFAKVYNIFDLKTELDVYGDTGRAGYTLEENTTSIPRGINTLREYYTRPNFYTAPRQIILGAGVSL